MKLHVGVGATGRPAAPYTADGYRAVLGKFMKGVHLSDEETLYDRFRKERIVFHGLRKNAVIMLLEAGCTEPMVGAIVNMSEQMVPALWPGRAGTGVGATGNEAARGPLGRVAPGVVTAEGLMAVNALGTENENGTRIGKQEPGLENDKNWSSTDKALKPNDL